MQVTNQLKQGVFILTLIQAHWGYVQNNSEVHFLALIAQVKTISDSHFSSVNVFFITTDTIKLWYCWMDFLQL